MPGSRASACRTCRVGLRRFIRGGGCDKKRNHRHPQLCTDRRRSSVCSYGYPWLRHSSMTSLSSRHVLLIISGGIAAFKALELIRLLRGRGCAVTCVLTEAGGQFVTPLSLQALS